MMSAPDVPGAHGASPHQSERLDDGGSRYRVSSRYDQLSTSKKFSFFL